ncbi:MAG: adenylyl-sulfate kinase, partial [Xanthobacteraceae bacterium]
AGDRAAARRIAGDAFREIYVATPAAVCERRDPKGHYAKARAGRLTGFTGIGTDYEAPGASELTIDTATRSITDATADIAQMLTRTGVLLDTVADLAAS